MLRDAEWINVAFFVLMSAIAMTIGLEWRQRKQALLFGTAGVLLTLTGGQIALLLPPASGSLVRDWLPIPLVLMAYRQAGTLYTRPNGSLEAWLSRFDASVGRLLRAFLRVTELRSVRLALEAAYLLAYPMVPLGLLALQLERAEFDADDFWRVVLPATYLCYMMLPLAPTRPPRLSNPNGTDELAEGRTGAGDGRRLNLWVLDHLGIGANTFPSGHVAATTATALVVASAGGAMGALFSATATVVALSVVVRRYHYAADALLGGALAVVSWWAAG